MKSIYTFQIHFKRGFLCLIDQKEQIKCMGLDGMQKMDGAINADLMTVEEIHQKLDAGYRDVKNERVQKAVKAFTEFQMKSR